MANRVLTALVDEDTALFVPVIGVVVVVVVRIPSPRESGEEEDDERDDAERAGAEMGLCAVGGVLGGVDDGVEDGDVVGELLLLLLLLEDGGVAEAAEDALAAEAYSARLDLEPGCDLIRERADLAMLITPDEPFFSRFDNG